MNTDARVRVGVVALSAYAVGGAVVLRSHATFEPGGYLYLLAVVGTVVVLPPAAVKYVGQPPNAPVKISRTAASNAGRSPSSRCCS